MKLKMRGANSLIDSMLLLTPEKRKQAISKLSNDEAEALLYDWELWARKEQLEPEGEWGTWLIRCGRGWGKTRTGAEWIKKRVVQGYRRIALVGETKADVRDTMIEVGDSGILNIFPDSQRPFYEPSKRRITFKSGAIATIYSGDEPDQLRGPQHDTAWVDELAKFKYAQEAWDNLQFGLRMGKLPRCLSTTTPRPIPIIKAILADKDCISYRGHMNENRANLSEVFIKKMLNKYEGTRLGRQELAGEILDDNPNALWTRDMIEKHRVAKLPELIRIVIAVDPEATNTEKSAETGIIAGGIDENEQIYVLDDATIKGSPDAWGKAAVACYHRNRGDRIVGEVNNGGDMIEFVIKSVDKDIPYSQVRATRGKYMRAEPVSALYEQGKVHHVGSFPQLEDQMCEWVPGDKSPDRLDALVWMITELMENAGGSLVQWV